MYSEAIRVAKKYCPQRVAEINMKLGSGKQGISSVEEKIQQAKTWEEQRDYSRAINA